MPDRRMSLTLDVVAALLLAISVTMLTDFAHRLLNANPDSAGIASISLQGLIAVAATSTFTRAGWLWVEGAATHVTGRSYPPSVLRVGLAGLLFVTVMPMWAVLPPLLAQLYNSRAFARQNACGLRAADRPRIIADYQRAISLDPGIWAAQFNLGERFEDSYQYDLAAAQYRKAIVANADDARAYSNLARVLLLQGDAATALRIADDGLTRGPDAETAAALSKNRAWAELNLGFAAQAIADAKASLTALPGNAAAHCVLAKAYAKSGQGEAARTEWREFLRAKAAGAPGPMVEPDCTRYAEVSDGTD